MNKIVIGLNLGDEGKGSIVNFLSNSDTLICRFNGGFQAAHNVYHNGNRHTFSQFGSGSLKGASTYLDREMIVDPVSMFQEFLHLNTMPHPCNTSLYVHEDCLVSTPYHMEANRILDDRNGHGSCGVGIGLTREMWSKTGDGLRWGDLSDKKTVMRKLHWIRQWCQDRICHYDSPYATEKLKTNFNTTLNDLLLSYNQIRPRGFSTTCDENIIKSYLKTRSNGVVIFEGSQGVHLDEVYGNIPHTTYSDTTPRRAVDLCQMFDLPYEIIGVTRTYETRHGNGPMFREVDTTYSYSEWNRAIEQDQKDNEGSFAGKFRVGRLNTAWVNEACRLCNVDWLAVNHCDQMDCPEFNRPIKIKGYGPEDKRWQPTT